MSITEKYLELNRTLNKLWGAAPKGSQERHFISEAITNLNYAWQGRTTREEGHAEVWEV